MFIKSLTLKNFRTYPDVDLRMEAYSLVSIIGRNGTGKSNLIEAIPYALFGKSRLKSEDENITDGADDLSVGVSITHRGSSLDVVRSKARGKAPKLNLS